MSIIIRMAQPVDLEPGRRIFEENYICTIDPAVAISRMNAGNGILLHNNHFREDTIDTTLVAEVDSKIVGWLSYSENVRLDKLSQVEKYFKQLYAFGLFVEQIVIDQDFKSQGIGTLLYQELFNKYPDIPIATDVYSYNTESLRFFTKNGLVISGLETPLCEEIVGVKLLLISMQFGGLGKLIIDPAKYLKVTEKVTADIEKKKPKPSNPRLKQQHSFCPLFLS
ncbi:MAG: GNAT family N-acetyltransferase [Alphaproteobacteria bacterium]|nr:GNAT family N-acetyltransferase [Alphaproteobacteria bacterium]MCL2505785.1 GNAT family N-acetyltransferase [Alphaproteobacteria bacterium]